MKMSRQQCFVNLMVGLLVATTVEGKWNDGLKIEIASLAHIKDTLIAGWFDAILEKARAIILETGLNQFHVASEKLEFQRTAFRIKIRGEAAIEDAFLEGLETIHRTGPVHIFVEFGTGDLITAVDVGIDNPSLHAKAVVKFMRMGPSTKVIFRSQRARLKVAFRIGVSNDTYGLKIALETFEILELGKLSLEMKGLGCALNFLGKSVFEILGNRLFKRQLTHQLQAIIKDLLILELPTIVSNVVKIL